MPVALDFEIDVAALGDLGYPVTVRSPGGGEATAAMNLPAEVPVLVARIPEAVVASSAVVRRGLARQEQPVRDLGSLLYSALLSEDVRGLLMTSRQQAVLSGEQLRIVLRISPPELACLPWEFLFDPGDDDYVCLSTPLIRRPQVLRPMRPLGVTGPLRVLGMVASPGDQHEVGAEEERRRLKAAMGSLAGRVELTWAAGQGWRDLRAALRNDGPWHVLHFIGHGGFDSQSGEGVLILAGEDGRSLRLSASDAALLVEKQQSVRLVVLNACDTGRASTLDVSSSVAGALLRRGIASVVAMQFPITDPAAVEFSRTFYEGLADGLPVDAAITEARHAVRISLPGTLEWGTPVLYMRSADGVVFDISQAGPGGRTARSERPAANRSASARSSRAPARTRPESTDPALLYTIPLARHAGYVTFSPNGKTIAVACGTTVQLADAATGQGQVSIVHEAGMRGVAFSPGGHRLATGSRNGSAIICDAATGGSLLQVRSSRSAPQLQDVAFSADGRLATAGEDGTARVWDSTSGQQLLTVTHDGVVYHLAFSPSGRLLATASFDQTARVWDSASGRQLLQLTHSREVYGVAFSPSGRRLATGGRDKTARVWDTSTGDQLIALPHGDAVFGVAFSAGGLLATASADKTARVWDASTGERLIVLDHDGIVDRAVFSPDGRLLATVTRQKSAQVWQLPEIRHG
jgi:hypothetical protein